MAAKKRSLHEARGITFPELGALLGTRELLRSKVMRNLHGEGLTHAHVYEEGIHAFDMETQCLTRECASISCIGGSMAIIMGYAEDDAKAYVGTYIVGGTHTPALRVLFFPPHTVLWESIKVHHAVKAIDNWLATGKPKWESIPGIKNSKGSK